MFEVITFGANTCDIFLPLQSLSFQKRNSDEESGKICFNLGDKIEAGQWIMASGGGGSNTACAFSRQGFKTAYCGLISNDFFGGLAINDLKKDKVSLKLTRRSVDKPTALSVILSPLREDRVILVASGASHFFSRDDTDSVQIKKAKWFYLAPLHEKAVDLAGWLVDFAQKNRIKVAFNPGEFQIRNHAKEIKKIIANVDLVLLNFEEAALLTGLPSGEEYSMARVIRQGGAAIVALTGGAKGALICDGHNYYQADIFSVEVKERTGAGDAFGSGFLAGLLQNNNLQYAIRLAMANSAGCLTQVGAKNGLLRKGDLAKWPALEIRKS